MTHFGAMGPEFHSFVAKTASLAIKTQRYIPGVDEYFIPKWKQIIAVTLIRAQACAARSIAQATASQVVAEDAGLLADD